MKVEREDDAGYLPAKTIADLEPHNLIVNMDWPDNENWRRARTTVGVCPCCKEVIKFRISDELVREMYAQLPQSTGE